MSGPYSVGFIIALGEEYDANEFWGGFRESFLTDQQDENGFIPFRFTDAAGETRDGIVGLVLDMTPGRAEALTNDLFRAYKVPPLMLNVGIAGALNSQIGDVVVAEYADQYDYRSKAVPHDDDHFDLSWVGDPYRCHGKLFDQIRRWPRTSPEDYAAWKYKAKARLERSEDLRALAREGKIAALPSLVSGPIASGNTVSAAKAFRERLLAKNKTFCAVEMEAAGFLRACTDMQTRAVALKGISDGGDEFKGTLDRTSKNALRAWAMSSALDLAATILREHVAPGAKKKGRITSSVADIRKEAIKFSAKHFKKHHNRLTVESTIHLARYDALFRHIVTEGIIARDNIFLDLAEHVVKSGGRHPLFVTGETGTGKTTFLTLLALAIDQRREAIALYINAKRYFVPRRKDKSPHEIKALRQDDFSQIKQLLRQASDAKQPIAVLIDGIDEYAQHDSHAANELLALVDRCNTALLVVADTCEFQRRPMGHATTKPAEFDRTVVLGSVPISDIKAIAAFGEAYNAVLEKPLTGNVTSLVLERAGRLRLETVNLLLLGLLLGGRAAAKLDSGAVPFLVAFCSDFLRSEWGHETLDQAAHLAFRLNIKREQITREDDVITRAWKLAHVHPIVTCFLVAHHAVNTLRQVGKLASADFADLEYVYPQSVNRFAKMLANATAVDQWEVFKGVRHILRHGSEKAKPNAAYIVARLEDPTVRGGAKELLQDCTVHVERRLVNQERFDKDQLLFARTVFISLAYLEDESASDRYINLLIDHPEWSDVNRGFHLEYYGDLQFDPSARMSRSDQPIEFPQTELQLMERIRRNLTNANYGLLNIEVFTLYSFVQDRHFRGMLSSEHQSKLMQFVPSLLGSARVSVLVKDFLEMLQETIVGRQFKLGWFVERLYGLKSELRAGWLQRGLGGRIESVAEHTYGAFLLGWLLLPESFTDWPEYNKNTVLQMVLIHDVAESLVGDVPFDGITTTTKIEETHAFQRIALWQSYPSVGALRNEFAKWQEFEHGTNENARIARDLDRLDNLVQLYLYQRDRGVPDFDNWKKQLTGMITTQAGKAILDQIHKYFSAT